MFCRYVDITVDVNCFSNDELKVIAALAFSEEPVTIPELSVATLIKPSVVREVVNNLLEKQVLKESKKGYFERYKLNKS